MGVSLDLQEGNKYHHELLAKIAFKGKTSLSRAAHCLYRFDMVCVNHYRNAGFNCNRMANIDLKGDSVKEFRDTCTDAAPQFNLENPDQDEKAAIKWFKKQSKN
jgi:hypothetical protein